MIGDFVHRDGAHVWGIFWCEKSYMGMQEKALVERQLLSLDSATANSVSKLL